MISLLHLLLPSALCIDFFQAKGDVVGALYGGADGALRLQNLIGEQYAYQEEGKVVKKSNPLASPRPDYGFTSKDIRYFVQHAFISMCNPWQLKPNTCYCKDKFDNVNIFRNDSLDSQAAVAVDPVNKLVVVSYRGSLSKKNWETNYDYVLVPHPKLPAGRQVHRGFLRHFQSLHRQVEPAALNLVNDPKHRGYKLLVTGYSLGGSTAAIAFPFWAEALKGTNSNGKLQLLTYSSPRPGNLAYARHLEGMGHPLIRYTKRGDVVPHIPDQSMGFSQFGQEFHDVSIPFVRNEIKKCASTLMEDPKCSLKDSSFSVPNHAFPLNQFLLVPPYCSRT